MNNFFIRCERFVAGDPKHVSMSVCAACCEVISLKLKEVLGWRFVSCHPVVGGFEVIVLFSSRKDLVWFVRECVEHSFPILKFDELPSDYAKNQKLTLYSMNEMFRFFSKYLVR